MSCIIRSYPIYTSILLRCTFTEVATGVLIDPTVVTLRVVAPDGTEAEYTDATNPSPGVYERVIVVNQAGQWVYRWEGSGSVQVSSLDTRFNVLVTNVPDI